MGALQFRKTASSERLRFNIVSKAAGAALRPEAAAQLGDRRW